MPAKKIEDLYFLRKDVKPKKERKTKKEIVSIVYPKPKRNTVVGIEKRPQTQIAREDVGPLVPYDVDPDGLPSVQSIKDHPELLKSASLEVQNLLRAKIRNEQNQAQQAVQSQVQVPADIRRLVALLGPAAPIPGGAAAAPPPIPAPPPAIPAAIPPIPGGAAAARFVAAGPPTPPRGIPAAIPPIPGGAAAAPPPIPAPPPAIPAAIPPIPGGAAAARFVAAGPPTPPRGIPAAIPPIPGGAAAAGPFIPRSAAEQNTLVSLNNVLGTGKTYRDEGQFLDDVRKDFQARYPGYRLTNVKGLIKESLALTGRDPDTVLYPTRKGKPQRVTGSALLTKHFRRFLKLTKKQSDGGSLSDDENRDLTRYNQLNGAGFFSSLWDGIKKVGSKAVDLVKDNPEIAKKGLDFGLKFLKGGELPQYAEDGHNLNEHFRRFLKLMKKQSDGGALSDDENRDLTRYNQLNGAGFFSSLWDGIKKVGSKAVDLVKDNPEIAKKGLDLGLKFLKGGELPAPRGRTPQYVKDVKDGRDLKKHFRKFMIIARKHRDCGGVIKPTEMKKLQNYAQLSRGGFFDNIWHGLRTAGNNVPLGGMLGVGNEAAKKKSDSSLSKMGPRLLLKNLKNDFELTPQETAHLYDMLVASQIDNMVDAHQLAVTMGLPQYDTVL